MSINADVIGKINQHLLDTIHTWLPGVRKSGQGYQACNPLRGDKDPSSMTIYSDGKAFDYASNKSYDCINLWAAQNNMDNGEAIKFYSDMLGISTHTNYNIGQKKQFRLLENKTGMNDFNKPEKPFPQDLFSHYKYGNPSLIHTYFDQNGELIGYTCRFETENGGKVVLPFTWSEVVGKNKDGSLKKGKQNWHWNAFGWKTNPIYGAEQLNQKPHATILICEGEKTADAAKTLLPDFVVLTWAGGVGKASKVKWDILKGRSVFIWPDADLKKNNQTDELLPKNEQPGMKAAIAIAAALRTENPKIILPPEGVLDGWDLADAKAEGWSNSKVFEYMTRSACLEGELNERLGIEIKNKSSVKDQPKEFLPQNLNPLIVISHQANFRGEIKPVINVPATIENYIQEFIVDTFKNENEFVVLNSVEKKPDNLKKAIIAKRSSRMKTQRALLTKIWCDCDNTIKKSATRESIGNHFSNILEEKREQELVNLQKKAAWDETPFEQALKMTTVWITHALVADEKITQDHIFKYEPQARALLHFIWQVKRKLFGLQAEMHMAPIFLGDQGNGKSEFIRNLTKIFFVPFGNFVRDAYVDEIGEEKNEAILACALINILDEMAGASKAEFNKVKNFITRYKVNPREFHSQQTMGEIINLSTFIGAANVCNLSEILHDESGNRRFFPINVHSFVNKKFNYEETDSALIIEKFTWLKNKLDCFPYNFDATPLWKIVNHEWPCFIRVEAISKIQIEHRFEPLKQWLDNFGVSVITESDFKSILKKPEMDDSVKLISTGLLREIFITMYKMNPIEARRWNSTKFGIELRKLGIIPWMKHERGLFYKCLVCALKADWTQIESKMRLPWSS